MGNLVIILHNSGLVFFHRCVIYEEVRVS